MYRSTPTRAAGRRRRVGVDGFDVIQWALFAVLALSLVVTIWIIVQEWRRKP